MRNLADYVNDSGIPLNGSEMNAIVAEIENAVTTSDQTLDLQTGPDTDLYMLSKAMNSYGMGASFFTDSGSANAYVLSRSTNHKNPTKYFDGMQIVFVPANANTGASTVNVTSLGNKALKDYDGTALKAGVLNTSFPAVFIYNNSAGYFKMVRHVSEASTPNENVLINGGFDVWQRNTTQTSAGYGSDDRWFNQSTGSTKTHSRQTFTLGQTNVPGNPKYYSRTVVVEGAGTSDYVSKLQRIEGVDTFAGETVTLSFHAKANASKSLAISYTQSFGTGGTPSSDVSGIGAEKVSLTTSWQKFEITTDISSISGKTLGTNGNDYLQIQFFFDAGSDLNTLTDSLGHQSGTFDLANVKLEKGIIATTFTKRPKAQELALCQRYYQKSYKQDVAPGTTDQQDQGSPNPIAAFTQQLNNITTFPVVMRADPTITIYSPYAGNATKVEDNVQNEIAGNVANVESSSVGIGLLVYDTASFTIGNSYQLHYTAAAEL